MKLYIMRHGETEWNRLRKIQGQSNIPLNQRGKDLAYITKKNKPFERLDLIYASPLIRAYETAQIMAEDCNLEIITDDRLKEISFGIGEGESLDEINKNPTGNLYGFLNHPGNYTPPEDGESFTDVERRIEAFINELILPLEKEKEHVLIVAHGAVIRILLSMICKIPYDEFWQRNRHKNCSITTFEIMNGKMKLLEEGAIYYKEDVEAIW